MATLVRSIWWVNGSISGGFNVIFLKDYLMMLSIFSNENCSCKVLVLIILGSGEKRKMVATGKSSLKAAQASEGRTRECTGHPPYHI
jgi:hypothetical protein